ncbi:hypothetical protein Taro_055485, partial [Colocasia esculenta]|nr:hypothetical protein [Colocasia esculenta]
MHASVHASAKAQAQRVQCADVLCACVCEECKCTESACKCRLLCVRRYCPRCRTSGALYPASTDRGTSSPVLGSKVWSSVGDSGSRLSTSVGSSLNYVSAARCVCVCVCLYIYIG